MMLRQRIPGIIRQRHRAAEHLHAQFPDVHGFNFLFPHDNSFLSSVLIDMILKYDKMIPINRSLSPRQICLILTNRVFAHFVSC